MDTNIAKMVLIILIAVVLFLLIILLLIKLGILGSGCVKRKTRVQVVKGGRNVDCIKGMTSDLGLNGFGENKSGTLIIGASRRLAISYWVYLVSNKTGQVYSSGIMDLLGIGRQNVNHYYQDFLVITEEPTISKIHAEITRNGKELFIQDRDSSNHTYVNGQQIYGITPIHSGDEIGFGNAGFTLRIREQ